LKILRSLSGCLTDLTKTQQHGVSRPVVESRSRHCQSCRKIAAEPCNNERTGSVKDDDLALRTALAATQDFLKQFRISPRVATTQILDHRGSHTQGIGLDKKSPYCAGFDGVNLGRTEGRNLVEVAGAVHGPPTLAAKQPERFRIDGKQLSIKNPCELEIRTGRIEQRTEQVKDRRTSLFRQSFADWRNGFECRMEQRCEEKAAPCGVQSSSGRQIEPNSKCLQDVRATTFRGDPAVPMLDNTRATSRSHKHDGSGDVEKPRPVPARAAYIKQPFAQSGTNASSQQHIDEPGYLGRSLSLRVEGSKKVRAHGERNIFVKKILTRRHDVVPGEIAADTKPISKNCKHGF